MVMPLLVDRLRTHLARTRLFAQPGEAIVAVSGGADLMALLDLLHELAVDCGLSLTIAQKPL